MRASRVVFLLLAVGAVSFLAGRASSPRRSDSRVVLVERAEAQPTREAPAVSLEPPPPSAPAHAPEEAVAIPSGEPSEVPSDIDDSPGLGFLRVEVAAGAPAHFVTIDVRSIWGEHHTLDERAAPEEPAWFSLAEGRYAVRWWSDEDMRRFGTLADVRAGRVTPVVVDPERPARRTPPPPGTGGLDVVVHPPAGFELYGIEVEVAGRSYSGEDEVRCETDRRGTAVFHLLPGDYEVRVGDLRLPARVEEGVFRRVDARHDGLGAVSIQGPGAELCVVGRSRIRCFLQPGRYAMFLRAYPYSAGASWSYGTFVGQIEVLPGVQRRFDPPPVGELRIVCDDRSVEWKVAAVTPDLAFNAPQGHSYGPNIPPLTLLPGDYVVTLGADDAAEFRRNVTVREGQVTELAGDLR